MKENLIFGASVLDFGAKPDGKTDCSDAFKSDADSGHDLIVFPYGKYLFKSPLLLRPNLMLELHPRAEILFDSPASAHYVSVKKKDTAAGGIIISGGIWSGVGSKKTKSESDSVFFLENVSGIKLAGITVLSSQRNAVSLSGVSDFRLENISVKTDSEQGGNGIVISSCHDGLIRNISYASSKPQSSRGAAMEFCKTSNKNIYGGKISAENCRSVISFDNACAENVFLSDISASFRENAVKVSDSGESCLTDTVISGVEAYNLSGTDSEYFSLSGKLDGFSIENFRRLRDFETEIKIPTLKLCCADSSYINADGLTLDEVISAKGASKLSDMTAAKICNPHGKYVYTVSASLEETDSLFLPLGDFSLFEANLSRK